MAKDKSPVIRCPKCGAPHGGVCGKLCPDCYNKQQSANK
jgi:NMD protein affecting ribosome stability and mRNA decay